jgi:Ca-activated chloride channel homolog
MIADFHFIRPLWLWALPLVALLMWSLIIHARHHSHWKKVCEPHLLTHLLSTTSKQHTHHLLLLTSGWLLTVLALAGPTWGKIPQPAYHAPVSTVIALDLSLSMQANDISPDRLSRAVHKLSDFLTLNRQQQTALLVFSESAHTLSPLTHDSETIKALLPILSTELMPGRGSRPDKAIRHAGQLLDQAHIQKGHIVLITDGIESDVATQAAQEIDQLPHTLHILAVGTTSGSPIQDPQGGFLKHHDGSIVIPTLTPKPLKALARKGGGLYRQITPTDTDINDLLAQIRNTDQAIKETDIQTDQWRDEGFWLIGLLLPLAAFGFRRGWLL